MSKISATMYAHIKGDNEKMWIMNQLKNCVINSDQITKIWVDSKTMTIKAITKNQDEYSVLGGYRNEDELSKAFAILYLTLTDGETYGYRMPDKGGVDEKENSIVRNITGFDIDGLQHAGR